MPRRELLADLSGIVWLDNHSIPNQILFDLIIFTPEDIAMETITLSLQNLGRTNVESTLQQWALVQGARVTPQGRLARAYKTKGTSMHWHLTGLRAGMGTVEVTYDPGTGKLDVSVHDNRRGYWALSASRDLAKTFSRQRKRC